MGRWRVGVFVLGLLGGLAGCAPAPPPPTVVNLTLAADANNNATPGGQGAPLVVSVYQLSSDAAFGTAEFFQLFSADQATLKTDMVKKDQYNLAPGGSKSATLSPNSTVTSIGIFAAYQNFQGVTWRAVVDVAPNKTTNINLQAGAKGIVVKTDPSLGAEARVLTMGWENKVVWTEGLFLQPQHLQQHDRYFERLVRVSTAALRPFSWGLTHLELDNDLLTLGKFAVRSAVGVLPDGTPFSVPDDVDHPRPLDLAETARNNIVYLLLPTRQPAGTETAPADQQETVARFALDEYEAVDSNAGYQGTAILPVGKLRLRYATEGEGREGHAALGLARIAEVRSDKSVVLDEAYIPPLLHVSASGALSGFVTQLQGLLHHRAEALAGRVSETATRGAGEIADYLMLQLCNRYEPLLTHFAGTLGQLHPEAFYQAAVSLAGELATFTEARKRAAAFPIYRHDDLQATFRPVMAALRQSLSAVLEQNAVQIPLQERKFGIRVGPISDRTLVASGTWVLAVKAQMPAEALRRGFPNLVKIGPVEQIRELINVALPGVAVRALPVAPRQLPYYASTTYFELDRSSPYWAALARSGGIAIHVTGDVPGLEIECWAIRG